MTGSAADLQAARAAAETLGLTAAALSSLPTVPTHDGDVPRVAIYSQWSGTQELGWYRHAFDQFGIPFDLIFKDRVEKGNLKADYDVIVMAAQNIQPDGRAGEARRASSALPAERQVQVPGHVRLDARHERRLRRGGRGSVREVPRTRAAR